MSKGNGVALSSENGANAADAAPPRCLEQPPTSAPADEQEKLPLTFKPHYSPPCEVHFSPPVERIIRTAIWFFLAPILVLVLASTWPTRFSFHIALCCAITMLASWAVCRIIPGFMPVLQSRGICGRDLGKPPNSSSPNIPESLGLVASTVFLLVGIGSQLLFSSEPDKLLSYNSGLLSMCLMAFLGFVDDIVELRWRYKVLLPLFASLPLALAYHGPTTVQLLPSWAPLHGPLVALKPWLVGLIDLGLFYHVYIILLTVFCANSINILAGINGLEVGQSIIISLTVIVHNILTLRHADQITRLGTSATPLEQEWALRVSNQHFLSLLLSIPFLGTSLGLAVFNWYPSVAFVGDCYTYFAGIHFAVVGVLGHFSKTLLLFFIPQVLNFLLSLPQLLKIIPCPRHRVPRLNPATLKLESSGNWTLLNAILKIAGPLPEESLCISVLALQVTTCAAALILRHTYLQSMI